MARKPRREGAGRRLGSLADSGSAGTGAVPVAGLTHPLESRLRAFLDTVVETTRAVAESGDRSTLLAESCRAIVGSGAFTMAWIGADEDGDGWIEPLAIAGDSTGYVQGLRVSTQDVPEGRGPTGTVARTGRPIVCVDMATDERMAPWRERLLAHGFRSGAAFPVRSQSAPAAVLSVYAGIVGAFGPDEAEILEHLADTIGFALDALAERDARSAAEAERTRLVSAVEQTADSIWMHDLDGSVSYVNPAFTRVYGYEPAEIVGQFAGIVDSGLQAPGFFPAIWASAASGKTWSGTIVNRRKDGSLVEVEAVISAIRDADGRLAGYVQADRDVTRERELEGALERDARERETIESALVRIDPAATPEAIAAAACAELLRLAGIDSAWAIGLGKGRGRILAVEGVITRAVQSGRPLPEPLARYLIERTAIGPWVETGTAQSEPSPFGEAVGATGLHTAAFAPLRGAHGVIGVIGFGATDPASSARIVERLPALATFGSIVGALVAPGLETRHREDTARSTIQAIIDAGAFTPFFQPIVDLHSGAVVGYEALSRFADGVPPDARFAGAARVGLGMELEMATLGAVVSAAAVLPPQAYLSLNVSPELVHAGPLASLLASVERPTFLEITEHVVIDDYPALRAELAALGPTVRLAVDDAGAGYASFRHILELAPHKVKLDIGLIRGIDKDPARQALLAGMAYFAVKRRIGLVAEGIETPAELRTLRSLAIPFGQGYLLGRPQDGRGPGPWPTEIDVQRR